MDFGLVCPNFGASALPRLSFDPRLSAVGFPFCDSFFLRSSAPSTGPARFSKVFFGLFIDEVPRRSEWTGPLSSVSSGWRMRRCSSTRSHLMRPDIVKTIGLPRGDREGALGLASSQSIHQTTLDPTRFWATSCHKAQKTNVVDGVVHRTIGWIEEAWHPIQDRTR